MTWIERNAVERSGSARRASLNEKRKTSMPEKSETNLFFRLVVAASLVFIVTIFAWLAVDLGNPQAPPARFLNEHAPTLIAWEVAVTIALGLLALVVDRCRTVRRDRDKRQESSAESPNQPLKEDGRREERVSSSDHPRTS